MCPCGDIRIVTFFALLDRALCWYNMDGIIGLAFPLSVSLVSASSTRAVLGHFAAALWRQEQLEQGEAGGRERRRRIDSAVAAVAFWGRSGEAVSSGAEHSSLSRYCASRLCSCLSGSGFDGTNSEIHRKGTIRNLLSPSNLHISRLLRQRRRVLCVSPFVASPSKTGVLHRARVHQHCWARNHNSITSSFRPQSSPPDEELYSERK